jgi:hypothetical protein
MKIQSTASMLNSTGSKLNGILFDFKQVNKCLMTEDYLQLFCISTQNQSAHKCLLLSSIVEGKGKYIYSLLLKADGIRKS